MLTMLAQYGNDGGGGFSYGPILWLILAAVVFGLVVMGTWFVRSRTRRSGGRSVPTGASSDRMNRAA